MWAGSFVARPLTEKQYYRLTRQFDESFTRKMEEKLAAYRERKCKEERPLLPSVLNKFKAIPLLKKSSQDGIQSPPEYSDVTASPSPATSPDFLRTPNESGEWEVVSETSDVDIGCPEVSWLTIATYVLSALLWLTLFAVAVNLEFGAVYFVVSSLYLLWKNTRTGPKKKGEISAYSVFNPNCKAIDGTLKAEQFEQEIRFGAASVR